MNIPRMTIVLKNEDDRIVKPCKEGEEGPGEVIALSRNQTYYDQNIDIVKKIQQLLRHPDERWKRTVSERELGAQRMKEHESIHNLPHRADVIDSQPQI